MPGVTPAKIQSAVADLRDYDFDRSTEALARIDAFIRDAHESPELRPVLETALARAAGAEFPLAARQFACEKLWMLGAEAAVPVIAALLLDKDPRVAEAGCYALGCRPSSAADEAVRAALSRAEGRSLAAVVQLAGARRDPGSVAALVKIAVGTGEPAAEAAVRALGKIASPEAIDALQRMRSGAASAALLEAAQRLRSPELLARLNRDAGPPWIRRGAALLQAGAATSTFRPIFNGRDLSEFIVDTASVWTVRNGVIIGKSPGLPYNEFLRTRASYENFVLRAKLRLINGYGNSGLQFRSKPVPGSHEVEGYQADAGERYWGSLYDESRRRKTLAGPGQQFLDALDPAAWHAYTIAAEGNRIRIELDGTQTVDYTEADASIPRTGFLALQVHGAKQPVEVWFRDLQIQIL